MHEYKAVGEERTAGLTFDSVAEVAKKTCVSESWVSVTCLRVHLRGVKGFTLDGPSAGDKAKRKREAGLKSVH